MRKINYLLLILFLLTGCFMSCDSADEDILVEEPKEYQLVSVMWKLDKNSGDSIEMVSEKLNETISNYGNVDMSTEYAFLRGVTHSSLFTCEDEDLEFLNKWLDDSVMLSIPTNSRDLSSTYISYISDDKVPLTLMKRSTMPVTDVFTVSGQLPPGMKETYYGTRCFSKIKATYCLQFADKNDLHNTLNVEGKWFGLIYDQLIDSGVVTSNIE